MDAVLKPRIGVGPLSLGESASELVTRGLLVALPHDLADDVTGWDSFCAANDNSIKVYSEEDRVIAISCESQCIFRGINLIGRPISEIESVFAVREWSSVEIEEVVDEKQTIYSAYNLGLDFWVDQSGFVVAVFCDAGSE